MYFKISPVQTNAFKIVGRLIGGRFVVLALAIARSSVRKEATSLDEQMCQCV